MRFAFYGRVSTEDQQDPEASRNWQLARARALVDKHGEIVAEFFDIGQSRSIPWKRLPEATRLLAAMRGADRGFDAVVIGEPQRAFYGNQYGSGSFNLPQHSPVAANDGPWPYVASVSGPKFQPGATVDYFAILADSTCAKQLSHANDALDYLPPQCGILAELQLQVVG